MHQKKQKPAEDIRKLFLIEFMKQVIIQYKIENNIHPDPVFLPSQMNIPQKPRPQTQTIKPQVQIPRPSQIQSPPKVQFIPPVKAPPQRPMVTKVIETSFMPSHPVQPPQSYPTQSSQAIQPTQPNQTYTPQQPTSQQDLIEYGLEKISPILSDPAVLSIECQGPGKPLLINKSGAIQVSPISLSQEEINSMMAKISEKTRIPIISGTFKAAFLNYLATGVISNFVGTRFIIQKKNPFRPS